MQNFNEDAICIHCHEAPVSDEETGLCSSCYYDFQNAMIDTSTEVSPELTEKERDDAYAATGADYDVPAQVAIDYAHDTFDENLLEDEDQNDDDEQTDDSEEEPDLLIDHYGDDLSQEEREERMAKDIEKAQDNED